MLISKSYLSLDGAFMLSPLSGAGFFEEMDWTRVSVDPLSEVKVRCFFKVCRASSNIPVACFSGHGGEN